MATTTVRMDVEARERLRVLEEKLGRNTVETLSLAVDALDRQLTWDDVAAWYEANSGPEREDEEWVGLVSRASR